MKPISWLSLTLWFVLASAVGFTYSYWAVGNGYTAPVSGISLSVSLVSVAFILLFLALPIYRYKRALKKIAEAKPSSGMARPAPVDPFYAVKVLLLSKAAAITSALFIGWHLGVIGFLLTTPVIAREVILPNIFALSSAIVLLVVAFIVQGICKLPNDGGSKDDAVAA